MTRGVYVLIDMDSDSTLILKGFSFQHDTPEYHQIESFWEDTRGNEITESYIESRIELGMQMRIKSDKKSQ